MFRTLMATPVCLPISQCIINTLCNICYLCQLLAAAALRNCAAKLDKVSAAAFDHDRGEWQTNETPDLFGSVKTCCSPLASPKLNRFRAF